MIRSWGAHGFFCAQSCIVRNSDCIQSTFLSSVDSSDTPPLLVLLFQMKNDGQHQLGTEWRFGKGRHPADGIDDRLIEDVMP